MLYFFTTLLALAGIMDIISYWRGRPKTSVTQSFNTHYQKDKFFVGVTGCFYVALGLMCVLLGKACGAALYILSLYPQTLVLAFSLLWAVWVWYNNTNDFVNK